MRASRGLKTICKLFLLVTVVLFKPGASFSSVLSLHALGRSPKLALFCSQHQQGNPIKVSASPGLVSSYMAGSETTDKTLRQYSELAEKFWELTKDRDVSQNRDALLRHMDASKSPAELHILDLGCGPGRDVKAFSDLGYRVTGLDGCPEFVEMGQQFCPSASFLLQDVHQLDLPEGEFDGIFANAVLFHVRRENLDSFMRKLVASLRPGGVLFTSNPRSMKSHDFENLGDPKGERPDPGMKEIPDMRYGHYQTLENWTATAEAAGLTMLEHYFRPPGKEREQQPWLATVSRRTA